MRIEIAGALATGKSTLAGILCKRGFRLASEDLSNNPYLDLRKVDPVKYEFLCQQRFVSDKLDAIERAVAEAPGHVVSDYCLAAEKAYIVHYLSYRPEWVESLVGQIDDGVARIGAPDAVVYLRCRPEVQLDRIRRRGREFEQVHDVGFIATINGLVEAQVDALIAAGTRVLEIDVEEAIPEQAADAVWGMAMDGSVPTAREAVLTA